MNCSLAHIELDIRQLCAQMEDFEPYLYELSSRVESKGRVGIFLDIFFSIQKIRINCWISEICYDFLVVNFVYY